MFAKLQELERDYAELCKRKMLLVQMLERILTHTAEQGGRQLAKEKARLMATDLNFRQAVNSMYARIRDIDGTGGISRHTVGMTFAYNN